MPLRSNPTARAACLLDPPARPACQLLADACRPAQEEPMYGGVYVAKDVGLVVRSARALPTPPPCRPAPARYSLRRRPPPSRAARTSPRFVCPPFGSAGYEAHH